MVVRRRCDTGELSLTAWKTPGRGRRASEVRRAVSNPPTPTAWCADVQMANHIPVKDDIVVEN